MEWKHYNLLRAHMWYIEKLLREIDSSLKKGESIYDHIEVDFTKEQIQLINQQIRQLYTIMENIRNTFNLKDSPKKTSRILKGHLYFIRETIDETRPLHLEKTSGKINSIDEKKQIDGFLNEILHYTNHIEEIMEKR